MRFYQKRFFVLGPHFLYYFKANKPGEKLRGDICLATAAVDVADAPPIIIRTPDKTYKLKVWPCWTQTGGRGRGWVVVVRVDVSADFG